jgi:hypothetical protein
MHPTDTRHLVNSRHEAFRAEADQARLAAIAKTHRHGPTPEVEVHGHASVDLVRRLVHRLAPA